MILRPYEIWGRCCLTSSTKTSYSHFLPHEFYQKTKRQLSGTKKLRVFVDFFWLWLFFYFDPPMHERATKLNPGLIKKIDELNEEI